MTKHKLETAYNRYIETGDVFGMWEGAVLRGRGRPNPPMDYETFERAVRSVPKPVNPAPPKPPPERMHVISRDVDLQWSAWVDELENGARDRAEQTAVIVTTSLWPARGRLVGIGDRHTYGRLVNREAQRK